MTDELSWEARERAGSEWATATNHRLFREIVTDTVTDRDFERYLRIEFAFIDTAAVALGAAVRVAPTMADRVVLAAGLNDLLTSQVAFFEIALGDDRSTIVPVAAKPLHVLFREVADRQSFADMLAAMLGAEWLYMTWCAPTAERPSSRATIRAWTELHTSPAFTSHAAWLRSRLDAVSAGLTATERERAADVFRRALAAEISFHDAVYEE
jgi:thiaminase/transcriptional activator TenA